MIPKRSQLPVLYGEQHDGIWIKQSEYLKKISVPNFLLQHWCFRGQQVRSMIIHRAMQKPLENAWSNINYRGLVNTIHSYDGCFVIRNSRADQRPSVHSWGLAIDINAATNHLGTTGDMSFELVKCFKDAGFVWGGDWRHPDPMHLQYCTED